ncbi:MAG: hypothetical protein IJ745_00805 [Bacteroidales bacterium]|nr:hypothetical protein [Bacteroidales bacterium]
MKKVILSLTAVVAMTVLASCDSKLCYCYENGYEQEVYTNTDTPCSSMTRGERGCVESNERMDPGMVALNPTL